MTAGLKALVDDSNPVINLSAMDGIIALANILEDLYSKDMASLIGSIILKYKGKQSKMQLKIQECLNLAVKLCTFEQMKGEIFPHLANPTPNVRHGTVRFIETIF